MSITTLARSVERRNRKRREYTLRIALGIVRDLKAAEESREPFHCIHGTYIGDPYGPDYMCGACESDITVYEYAIGSARAQVSRERSSLARELMERLAGGDVRTILNDDEYEALLDVLCGVRRGR